MQRSKFRKSLQNIDDEQREEILRKFTTLHLGTVWQRILKHSALAACFKPIQKFYENLSNKGSEQFADFVKFYNITSAKDTLCSLAKAITYNAKLIARNATIATAISVFSMFSMATDANTQPNNISNHINTVATTAQIQGKDLSIHSYQELEAQIMLNKGNLLAEKLMLYAIDVDTQFPITVSAAEIEKLKTKSKVDTDLKRIEGILNALNDDPQTLPSKPRKTIFAENDPHTPTPS